MVQKVFTTVNKTNFTEFRNPLLADGEARRMWKGACIDSNIVFDRAIYFLNAPAEKYHFNAAGEKVEGNIVSYRMPLYTSEIEAVEPAFDGVGPNFYLPRTGFFSVYHNDGISDLKIEHIPYSQDGFVYGYKAQIGLGQSVIPSEGGSANIVPQFFVLYGQSGEWIQPKTGVTMQVYVNDRFWRSYDSFEGQSYPIGPNTSSTPRTFDVFCTITFEGVTYTSDVETITQEGVERTYAIELGASRYIFPASGGSYTISVEGVVYDGDREIARVPLYAPSLTITNPATSTRVTRNGLELTAEHLRTIPESATSGTFTITWSAYPSATATFTTGQSANTPSPGSWAYTRTLSADTSLILASGENRSVHYVSIRERTITWSSGSREQETQGYQSTVSADGALIIPEYVEGEGSFTVRFPANPSSSQRGFSIAILGGNTLSFTQAGAVAYAASVYADKYLTLRYIRFHYTSDNYSSSIELSNIVVELTDFNPTTGSTITTEYPVDSITMTAPDTFVSSTVQFPLFLMEHTYKARIKSATQVGTSIDLTFPTSTL